MAAQVLEQVSFISGEMETHLKNFPATILCSAERFLFHLIGSFIKFRT